MQAKVVGFSSRENLHVHVVSRMVISLLFPADRPATHTHPHRCTCSTRMVRDTLHNIIPISLARGVKIINYSYQKRMDFSSCLQLESKS